MPYRKTGEVENMGALAEMNLLHGDLDRVENRIFSRDTEALRSSDRGYWLYLSAVCSGQYAAQDGDWNWSEPTSWYRWCTAREVFDELNWGLQFWSPLPNDNAEEAAIASVMRGVHLYEAMIEGQPANELA